MGQTKTKHDSTLTFRLACWVMGLIAFIQIITAGVALAVRVENAREVRVETEIVTKIVTVAAKPEPKKEASPVVALPPLPPTPVETPLPPARPLDAPAIADAKVEQLVLEGREARVAEDMGRAIIKLEEARSIDSQEPNTLYELGLVYETMAAYDTALAEKAAEAYQAVFELGTTKAGALYPLAARKLRDGIARPVDMRGKLSLGRVRIFKDDAFEDGERVVLTVPVSAAPDSNPSADDFFVKVEFFDKIRNKDPQPAGPNCVTNFEWASGEIDWLGGEEILRVTYILPPPEPGQEHLFGHPEYYGQIVELVYKNELLDSQAWPRHLASRSKVEPQQSYDPMFLESDFDPNLGVLPPLENELELPPMPDELELPPR
ncbi:hypothetical protein ACFQY0_19360 [Haloferula chungangensis]|uniref:Tetratricopeptide repeat protein n=1 Tax=Haloferula chungangensis TaxID=1048331 RepID=A0ABW2LA83_9BACT